VSEFSGVGFAFSALRTRGIRQGGIETLTNDATIGNAEFVNVLKTAD
jgi:hypothetical protein